MKNGSFGLSQVEASRHFEFIHLYRIRRCEVNEFFENLSLYSMASLPG